MQRELAHFAEPPPAEAENRLRSNPRQVMLCHCAVAYTQAEPLLSWLEEPACGRLCLHSSPNPSFVKGGMRGFASSIFISHPKPLPLIREGLVASVPLASCALGIVGKLGMVGNTCVMCAILGKLSSAIVRWLCIVCYCCELRSGYNG